ncbi:MAG: LysR substrate-binding domain-containing protein, partial [Pseudomonadota bacterium]
MSERLNGIEAFVAAVEAGNFALAAQRLRLTRSAVGKSVARLEERLGTRLFHRTTRSQSLTEDGHAYYERCRRALAELDAADAAVEAGRQTPTGRVRITMPALIGRTCVAPLLLELAQRHPQLAFDVSFSDRRIDIVDEGFDLAVRSGELGDSAALVARPLGHQWMGVYASPDYLTTHGRLANVQALIRDASAHRFVGYARATGSPPWQFNEANDADHSAGRTTEFVAHTRFAFSCDSLEVSAMAAIRGMGMARLPTWLVADA